MRHQIVVPLLLLVVAGGCNGKKIGEPKAGGRPLSHWLEALHEKDPAVRAKAATKLGNIGPDDPAVVPALIAATKDADAAVRAEAILSLLKIGPKAKEAAPALTEALKDRAPKVRQYAEKALARVEF